MHCSCWAVPAAWAHLCKQKGMQVRLRQSFGFEGYLHFYQRVRAGLCFWSPGRLSCCFGLPSPEKAPAAPSSSVRTTPVVHSLQLSVEANQCDAALLGTLSPSMAAGGSFRGMWLWRCLAGRGGHSEGLGVGFTKPRSGPVAGRSQWLMLLSSRLAAVAAGQRGNHQPLWAQRLGAWLVPCTCGRAFSSGISKGGWALTCAFLADV